MSRQDPSPSEIQQIINIVGFGILMILVLIAFRLYPGTR
jgi:hypothetical protein